MLHDNRVTLTIVQARDKSSQPTANKISSRKNDNFLL